MNKWQAFVNMEMGLPSSTKYEESQLAERLLVSQRIRSIQVLLRKLHGCKPSARTTPSLYQMYPVIMPSHIISQRSANILLTTKFGVFPNKIVCQMLHRNHRFLNSL